jgi:hypothetical protein
MEAWKKETGSDVSIGPVEELDQGKEPEGRGSHPCYRWNVLMALTQIGKFR